MILIPAFNEEECIADVINEVHRDLPQAEVVVIDDGSSDRTAEIARQAGAVVLQLPFNLGVGGALRAGLVYAHQNGAGAAVQIDGDGQHVPAEVPALLAELDYADMVIGARFAGKGEYESTGPRRWAMVMLASALSRITGEKLSDTTSGFRAFGPRAIHLLSKILPAEYLGDTIDALVSVARADLTVTQVPVEMRPRQGGTASTSPMKSAVYLARSMITLLLSTVRREPTLKLGAHPGSTINTSGSEQ